MEDLKVLIKTNLESIIQQRFAEGKTELSTKKLISYLSNKYGIEVDDDLLNELLTDNPNVESVVEDKITLGTPEQKEEESLDDDIHDTAVDQASKDLDDGLTFESVVDAIENIKTGMIINPRTIKLNESEDFYHLHNGARKAKVNYIVSNILPKKDLTESLIRCKIDKSSLFVEIPVKYFLKNS